MVFSICALFAALLHTRAFAENGNGDPPYQEHIGTALHEINLSLSDLSLPKLGIPYSTPARQPAVDSAMQTPLWMLGTGAKLSSMPHKGEPLGSRLTEIMTTLRYTVKLPQIHPESAGGKENGYLGKLASLRIDSAEKQRLSKLIIRLSGIAEHYLAQHAELDPVASAPVAKHIQQMIRDSSDKPDHRQLSLDQYHQIGRSYSASQQAGYLLLCLEAIREFVDATHLQIDKSVTWDTPLGRIGIAGAANNVHSGHFFLLIDSGGNDSYNDVGNIPPTPGFTFVIDLKGNDRISWKNAVGPGAGIFGIGVWVDRRGNDVYLGRNAGLGVGVFGAGALWDAEGDDSYLSGSLSQGAGQYGIGILLDEAGNDRFTAEMSSQGYGGTGGLGILVNDKGNDRYRCGNAIPDQAEDRVARHKDKHYISMCQGYSFGRRPDISGGVGLLIDHAGDDVYEADIFAQGGSYWFGLGMLIDSDGNDKYSAFEHAQGASLHLGAAFLGDYAGNDSYTSYEHSQGVGVDRSVGILLNVNGDDSYHATHESQGTGIKPYGIGILVDTGGNDRYTSQTSSQGYAVPLSMDFPEQQWPVGLLLDLQGTDSFQQLPPDTNMSGEWRIQNRQGVALDYMTDRFRPGK